MATTTNGWFYLPPIYASGDGERTSFHAAFENIDNRLSLVKCVGDPAVGFANLAQAVDTLNTDGSDVTLIVPAGMHSLSDNLTANSNIHIVGQKGTNIYIPTGILFTISGSFEAGRYRVFTLDGTGSVVFSNLPVGLCPLWWGETNLVKTFTASDATPSVGRGTLFKTANAVATTITEFDDVYNGQEFTVIVNDIYTTLDFTGTNLIGNGGYDYVCSLNDRIRVIVSGTSKYCQIIPYDIYDYEDV